MAITLDPTLGRPDELTCDHQTAPLAMTSLRPHLSWHDHPTSASLRGVYQTKYRVLVASSLAALGQDDGNVWDSGKVLSAESFEIPYLGTTLKSLRTYYWKVKVWDANDRSSVWSVPAAWTTAPSEAFSEARWIADTPDSTDPNALGRGEGDVIPMPVFRKHFETTSTAVRSLLYVSGLGQYEINLNGRKVGGRELSPGWTDYRKTVLYNTYDVTTMLHSGDNVIGVLLGNGMYNVRKTKGRYTKLVNSYGQPKCIVALYVLYAGGSSTWVDSDQTWRTAPGPIVFSSTYGGEDYDATKETTGWESPRYHDSSWRAVDIVNGPGGKFVAESIRPVQVVHIYDSVSRRKITKGRIVYDLGQNFAGWPRIVVRGLRGSQIKLIPGELLNPDGSVSQRGSGQPQWFTYTMSGADAESWRPAFSYYGFRYVEARLTGPPKHPSMVPHILQLRGEAVHSTAEETGGFSTSNALLNRVHMLILQSMRNNMESVLTDCPHREKLGWLEETHLLGSALNYDFDLELLYEKLSRDMADAQEIDGMVPEIAPRFVTFEKPKYDIFNDSPEWGSAIILDPWIVYQRYGDLDNLRLHYDEMRSYLNYLTDKSEGNIITYGLGDWYDIGPANPGVSQLTTAGVTATSIYYEDLLVMQQAAQILQIDVDANAFGQLALKVRAAFNARFYHPDSQTYDRGSQTANAMALSLGLVSLADRENVLDHLVADIRLHHNHVTAGDVGFHYVVDALLEGNRSDVLMAMMSRTDAPSYGYQLRKGATTLTEAWDANPASSQDHFMLGDAEEWFYRGVGGITVDFSRMQGEEVVIAPSFVVGITSAHCSYKSVKGRVSVSWKRMGQRIHLDLTVPANENARINLPKSVSAVSENNLPAAHSVGIKRLGIAGRDDAFEVASGTYQFSFLLGSSSGIIDRQ